MLETREEVLGRNFYGEERCIELAPDKHEKSLQALKNEAHEESIFQNIFLSHEKIPPRNYLHPS